MKPEKEFELFQIAESQAGYFTTSQAKEIGIQRNQIYRDVDRGKLLSIEHGIYRFRQFPADRFEDLHIALLQAGEKAIVGFVSALDVYDLSDMIPYRIHLILPKTSSRRRPGIKVHTTQLEPEDITVYQDLRITTVARTISDCAFDYVPDRQIELAVHQALTQYLTTEEELISQSKRRSKRVQNLIADAIKEVGQ